MASVRSRAQLQVGSARWVNDENDQVAQFCAQEIEDFAFSARNEVEWLNEHMADIFSKNHKDITDCFKTPGKLRGKTPRTARKRNPLEAREPLTDIFAANARPNNSPSHKASPSKQIATFQVAEDPVVPVLGNKAPKSNTDSGYHGLPEDDMVVDDLPTVPHSSAETNDTMEVFPTSPAQEQPTVIKNPDERSTTERSFHSAKEELPEKVATEGSSPETKQSGEVDREAMSGVVESGPNELNDGSGELPTNKSADIESMDKDLDEDLIVDETRSPSQGSSPARPLTRKSSLTFAPLPPRDFTAKKSMGARGSQVGHTELSKGHVNRGSLLEQFAGGKSLGGSKQLESALRKETDGNEDPDAKRPDLTREESDIDMKMTKLHNKSSTQRLHDRINMLGQPRTKSIPAAAAVVNPSYPELPKPEPQAQQLQHIAGLASKAVPQETNEEDDDDWIKSPQHQRDSPSRPRLPKSTTVDVMEDIIGKQTVGGETFHTLHNEAQVIRHLSPFRQGKEEGNLIKAGAVPEAASMSRPTSPIMVDIHANAESKTGNGSSTTPIGSPSSKRYVDGPLSASKSKLQSIMKTARGLFSSSAGVSAQAKMETLSPTSLRTREESEGISIDAALSKQISQKARPRSPTENLVGRKTRSSTEKEQKQKETEKRELQQAQVEPKHDKEGDAIQAARNSVQEKGPIVGAVQQPTKPIRQSPRRAQIQDASSNAATIGGEDMQAHPPNPAQGQAQGHQSQLQRPKDVRRPQKPAKEIAPKSKPPPVAIKVGTISGMRMNNALSSSLQESLPPSQPKQTVVIKKPSNPLLHPMASNSSLKSSVSATAKPKALLAAERKKEQDEKEAQRKLDQKREIERKRAAQQEDARKQEQLQRQEAERQRERERSAAVEDPKVLAKKQAIEKRRMEMKKEQQRVPQRTIADHAPNAQQVQAAPTSRQELGGQRPASRLHNPPDHGRLGGNQPLPNQAKPSGKRIFDPEADEELCRPDRLQGGPAYQANESKRRKTENEEVEEVRVRPTMAPPIRQSGIRQGGMKPSIFNSSYTAAPPPAPHRQPSLLKSTTANQAYQQHAHQNQMSRPGHHPDIAKYQNGKIPFADNPNPPSQPHKTPLPSSRLQQPNAAKSSPHYPNGDNIHLDDIPTESEEDSDSDADTSNQKKPPNSTLPDWAQSPQLRELLMTQDENMDADAVFGPVQSPHMEEMFRERHHRFRSRTSSANWQGQDRLTEEEIRRDVEARKRLRREGGWTFGL